MNDTVTVFNNLFKSHKRDPLNVRDNFYVEVSELLRDLKANREMKDGGLISLRERIAAMAMIGRMTVILGLGKEDDSDTAGSSVRKYEAAFKDGSGKRKKTARSRTAAAAVLDGDNGEDDDSFAS